MKKNYISFLLFLCCIIFYSCSDSNTNTANADYSFEVARDVLYDITDFKKVKFYSGKNLDLGFYKGQVWIKLEIFNRREAPVSHIVLCNDLINHNYRFYKLNSETNTYTPYKSELDLEKYDHRTFKFAKPNFRIDLGACEKGSFIISTTSDGRILQAAPKLISVNDFLSIKQNVLLFDIVFYGSVILLLIVNLFYYRLVTSKIYFYYATYILSGCLMYLFVEGRLYGVGLSNFIVDHLMFISIRVWILFSILFTLNFLETKKNNPNYYKFIIFLLFLTLGGTTIYQFVFYNFSISTLHQFENIIGFVWIVLSLTTVGVAFKKRKKLSIYYLIPYSAFLLFVSLGLIDSHTAFLIGDPFSYFKVGTILEFVGFTYFIAFLVKQKLVLNEKLEQKLSRATIDLEEKEKLLISNKTLNKADLVSVFGIIENSFENNLDWHNFKQKFADLAPNFIPSLLAKHTNLSKSEIRLLTLVRIGYSQKEMACILNIAPDSVKKAKSRVRKKLDLPTSIKLYDYLIALHV